MDILFSPDGVLLCCVCLSIGEGRAIYANEGEKREEKKCARRAGVLRAQRQGVTPWNPFVGEMDGMKLQPIL
ncbi:MAG: hypothetical protein L3J67_01730 [Hyphomicrobiaceae bacterium]|nr:hypothetical protein [Hyphomicrobiaceae bacterium]